MTANDAAGARAAGAWAKRMDGPALVVASAPGRVNLIGEHVDYCGGVVLPLAIDRRCVCLGAPPSDGAWLRAWAEDAGEWVELSAADAADPARVAELRRAQGAAAWAGYVAGAAAGAAQAAGRRLEDLPGLRLVVAGDVPLGAGLSSSAALEVAVAACAAAVWGLELRGGALVQAAVFAERAYAGVPCGIMDQTASAMGEAGRALRLDCLTGAARPVPLGARGESWAELVVVESGVRHALADGAYAERRRWCEEAAAALGVEMLAEAPAEAGEAAARGLAEGPRRAIQHVLPETARAARAAAALEQAALDGGWPRAWAEVGRLMNASHASLRDVYGVSCAEVDAIVEAAAGDEVLGARLTGAGFGGSVLVACRPGGTEKAVARIVALCRGGAAEGGPRAYRVRPAAGVWTASAEAGGVPVE